MATEQYMLLTLNDMSDIAWLLGGAEFALRADTAWCNKYEEVKRRALQNPDRIVTIDRD